MRLCSKEICCDTAKACLAPHFDKSADFSCYFELLRQKQAEEELVKSKAMLQAAIDCLPFTFFAIGLDGRYTLQNAVSKALQQADVIGKLPEEVCPNEHDLAIWLDNNRRAFAREKVEGEVAFSLGGEERFYYNVIAPISDGTEFYGILGVNIDITERKRAEEALQKAHNELEQRVEERTAELSKANEDLGIFRKFAEASGEGLGMSDFDGRIIYVNQRLARLFGEEKPEDLIGKNVSLYSPEEYKQRRKDEVIPALLRDGYWYAEHTILPLHGNPTPVSQSTFLIQDGKGNPFRLGAVISDITERKQAEAELRQSEERYELAVRGAGVGIWDWDIRTGKLYFSPRWKAIFGYGENDIGDSVEDWARLLHPDEKDWMLKFLEDFLAGTCPTVAVEYRLRHKDGSYRWIVAHGLVVRDEQGKACRFVGSHGDITDRKRAEDALERERQSLWRMLQASDHERQTISYEIHDGLAQYLAAATMQFQAHDSLRENSPKEAKKAYETAMELVRQAHSESRRLISEVRPPVIDEDGVEMAVSHLVHDQRRCGGPKIECHSDVQFGRLPAILENAIYRIVQEALTNACKHSKSKKVTVSMTQEGQDVRLEVRDWGIGFDPESVEEGHFGLESIRQRVRLLGGRLTIETAPDSGTLVQVIVPILEKQNDG